MHSILFHNAETVAASENECILEIRSNIRHDFEWSGFGLIKTN